MKKLLLILAFVFLVALAVPAAALAVEIPVTLRVNDSPIAMDAYSFVEDGRAYVPIRFASLALEAETISWCPVTRTAEIVFPGDLNLQVDPENSQVLVNGEPYGDAGALMRDGRIYLPLRDVAELTGVEVSFDSRGYIIDLFKEGATVPEEIIAPAPDEKQWLWLARIVEVEARGSSPEARLAVASVVMNRVNSSRFPNSVHDVIFQPGQFPPAYKAGFTELEPTQLSWQMARAAMYGVNNAPDCLFFNSRPFSGMSSRFYRIIGGNYFYR